MSLGGNHSSIRQVSFRLNIGLRGGDGGPEMNEYINHFVTFSFLHEEKIHVLRLQTWNLTLIHLSLTQW